MKLKATVGLLGLMIIALACSEGSSVVTGPTVFEIDPVFSMTAAAAGGSCPDLFYETTVTLPNGASVTWTSSFGGFDYAKIMRKVQFIESYIPPPKDAAMFPVKVSPSLMC